VFGGPWAYGDDAQPATTGEDAEWLAGLTSRVGAVVAGRWTYEAARHWVRNAWGPAMFIVTYRHAPRRERAARSGEAGLQTPAVSRTCVRRRLLPEGSRKPESMPYGRSSGGSVNSTPRLLSSS
jgi:hypothetical protein